MVYADIELINAGDLELAKRNLLDQDDIKRMHINILVDTGSYMMAINENLQEILKLGVKEKKRLQLASGGFAVYDVVGPLDVRFEDRTATCNAVVLPGDSEPLLGAIPMEEMGVLINPQGQELILHPDPYPYLRLLHIKPYRVSRNH